MKLSDKLNQKTIIAPIKAIDRDASIEEILNQLVLNDTLISNSKLLEYIENIEDHKSTAAGKGVAYPHSVSIEVDDLEVVLGISIKGIDYSAPDGQLCHFILLTLTPLDDPNKHRKFVTLFRTMIDNPEIRTKLLDSISCQHICKLIEEWEKDQIEMDDLE